MKYRLSNFRVVATNKNIAGNKSNLNRLETMIVEAIRFYRHPGAAIYADALHVTVIRTFDIRNYLWDMA